MDEVTYSYADESSRYIAARGLYERFCEQLKDDPNRAMAQLTSGIQSALAQAYAQGVNKSSNRGAS